MKYYVYVPKSIKDGSLYIGMTSKDPRIRLKDHNQGSNIYTKGNLPCELIYYEMNYCSHCAREREKFLKSGQGRILIKKLLDNGK